MKSVVSRTIILLLLHSCVSFGYVPKGDVDIKHLEVSVVDRSNCTNGVNTTIQLANLRRQMKVYNISAYIINTNDEHQSEYVSRHDQRREYISGFTGSNGDAVVTMTSAALWTDSRYYIQAGEQLDCNWKLMMSSDPSISTWLPTVINPGDRVSADSKIMSFQTWKATAQALDQQNISMVVLEENLVDNIWGPDQGRPPYSDVAVTPLDLIYAGVTWQDKIISVRSQLANSQRDAIVIVALDETAWLLNLRGGDIPYTPVFISYVIVEMKQTRLYLRKELISDELRTHLNSAGQEPGDSVSVKEYEEFWADLVALGGRAELISLPAQYSYFPGVSYQVYKSLPKDKIKMEVSQVLLSKDYKNQPEADDMKKAHIRDAVALCHFLYVLERDIKNGSDEWTELRAVQELDQLRSLQINSFGPSFETIVAFGPNGAMPHYTPSEGTNRKIDNTSMLTIDSGGQYYEGTTDVTRSMHYGTPTDIQAEIYTRLLMGCINLVTAIFPRGRKMSDLEYLIRGPLNEIGLDYGHGSTHGIGSFLIVHESFNTTYHPFFFGSQEPGYYEDGEYGMRLENIATVVEANTRFKANPSFLTFDTVTLVPYERNLLNITLLEPKHITWINNYHNRVQSVIGSELLEQGLSDVYQWLVEKTSPIRV